jgi:hypothetical protein
MRGAGRNPSEFLFGLSSAPNWIGKFRFLLRKRDDSVVRGLPPVPSELTDRAEAVEESEVHASSQANAPSHPRGSEARRLAWCWGHATARLAW